MNSRLAFRGGPLDGETEPTKVGWPAPGAYSRKDIDGRYVMQETVADQEEGVVTHFYDYEREEL